MTKLWVVNPELGAFNEAVRQHSGPQNAVPGLELLTTGFTLA